MTRGSSLWNPSSPSTSETGESLEIRGTIIKGIIQLFKTDASFENFSLITTASDKQAVILTKTESGFLIGVYIPGVPEEESVSINETNVYEIYIEKVRRLKDVKKIDII